MEHKERPTTYNEAQLQKYSELLADVQNEKKMTRRAFIFMGSSLTLGLGLVKRN